MFIDLLSESCEEGGGGGGIIDVPVLRILRRRRGGLGEFFYWVTKMSQY